MAIQTTDRYCPICGKDVTESSFKRFGEWACSETHAEEYVKAVRAEKARAVVAEPRREDRPTRQGCCG